MPDFPHLSLKRKLDGRYQFASRRIEKKIEPQTAANLLNRSPHAANLTTASQTVLNNYSTYLDQREVEGLPRVFDPNIVPLFLQIDPKDFDIESLKGFGIEIVSEEEDGFIIGANTDNFRSLADKIDKFVNEEGKFKDQTAKLWKIVQGTQWRIDHILSESLREKYMAGIADGESFTVDISVACYLKLPERPVRVEPESDEDYADARAKHIQKKLYRPEKKDFRVQRLAETDEHFDLRLNRWRRKLDEAEMERDEIAAERQAFLTYFIQTIYLGSIDSGFIDLQDSFGFRATMSGQALKDLINGYPFVFEISEWEQIDKDLPKADFGNPADVEIIGPALDASTICIIDSGLQEQHILLAPAVLTNRSINYVPGENTTSDQVTNGGHGTKVAGAILFGNKIPGQGQYQLPCFLANARVLNSLNNLPTSLYPPQLMKQIVEDYNDVRIFNMSIASRGPCRTVHISTWAATIDKLIHELGIMFLLACGNISISSGNQHRPGIKEHLQSGRMYPDYLFEATSRVSNPGQSLLALTVGSVCHAEFEDIDRKSFGKRDHVSSFSRSGPGMWGCVKPDVVEYGGDFLKEKNGYLITQYNTTSAQVVKTGAGRIGWDVGTSFATPKVAHIVALLANKFPNDSTLLYKALVVQSARLPEHVFHNPEAKSLRVFGYGIPDAVRALENTPYRITFVAEGVVAAQQANLYSLSIPDELRRAGRDFDVLVEVTLTYSAAPRRTRKRLKSYFGSWLTWESSKLEESFDKFSARVLKNMEEPDEEAVDPKSIRWSIHTSPRYGTIPDFKRQDSATQKDWVVLKSNELPNELSFAVVGHKGWDKDTIKELPFALAISLEAISNEIEIYERIEAANRVEVDQPVEIRVGE